MTDKIPSIFCAIDTPDIDHARSMARAVSNICGIKLGLEFFNAHGLYGVHKVMDGLDNTPLFLDLKYHDIPNTVAGAVRAVSPLKPTYLNVHAAGGYDMMRAAKDACGDDTKLLAVTVLTSIDARTLDSIGQGNNAQDQVTRLALLSQKAELDGVVCSAFEIEPLRAACGLDFTLMVPGIRPVGSDIGDQKRVMTPKQAMDHGATHIVIGRPITKSDNPAAATAEILASLAA